MHLPHQMRDGYETLSHRKAIASPQHFNASECHQKKRRHFEGEGIVITWASGHLLSNAEKGNTVFPIMHRLSRVPILRSGYQRQDWQTRTTEGVD
jgi:hypothetical protein